MSIDLPAPPPVDELRRLGIRPEEYQVVDADTEWWRVHMTTSPYSLPWNAFRTYGPKLRFDPHPPPEGFHADYGIWYGASSAVTALAEVFQSTRTIEMVPNTPYLTAFSFTRPVKLLNVADGSAGTWPTRVGGSYAMSTAPHATTQQWAHAIVSAFPDLDGIYYLSRFGGEPAIALFTPAQEALPAHPLMSLPLTHRDLLDRLAVAARRLGYGLV
ncbi:RES domain-containing protein [Mycobacteroides abscessus subsp. abscessus]|nr:RES domain-containing protein [Mycobacteroides abscessus subsp. abscessus]